MDDQFPDPLRNLIDGQDPGEDRGGPDEEHHAARHDRGSGENGDDFAPRDFLVKKLPEDEGVQDGYHGDFRRRGRAADDAAQDDHGEHQGDDRPSRRFDGLFESGLFVHSHTRPDRLVINKRHDAKGDDDGGEKPPHEKGAHGDAGDPAKDHHGDARRNENPHGRGRRNDGDGIFRTVPRLFHGRGQQGGDRRDVGDRRAGNAGKKVFPNHDDHAQTAADMTHDHLGQGDEPHGHPAEIHQFTGKNEKRNGQQGKGVDPSEQAGMGHNEGHLLVQEQKLRAADAEGKRNRHAGHDEKEKGNEHHGNEIPPGKPPSAEDEINHAAQGDGSEKGNDECLPLQAEGAHQKIADHQGTGKGNGYIEIGKGNQHHRREILCRFVYHHYSHIGEIDTVVEDKEIGRRRNIPPRLGTDKGVQQRFNGDMALRFEGQKRPHKTDPDEQDARHLFRPGNGAVENVPADHLGKDEHVQCKQGECYDPIENFLRMIPEECHFKSPSISLYDTLTRFDATSCSHPEDLLFIRTNGHPCPDGGKRYTGQLPKPSVSIPRKPESGQTSTIHAFAGLAQRAAWFMECDETHCNRKSRGGESSVRPPLDLFSYIPLATSASASLTAFCTLSIHVWPICPTR